jgi:hypothetical protein
MIATAVLAADYAGTLDLNEVTMVRARATQGQDAALDFVETATASAQLHDRLSAYTLTLSPMLTLPSVEQSFQPQLLNVGTAIAAWHYRKTSFSVTEGAMYGLINSSYLVATQQTTAGEAPIITTVPQPKTFTLIGSTTDATFRQAIGHRVVLSLSADYLVSGGADAVSREVLPEEYGPRAIASLAYTLTRHDVLTTRAIVQEIRTTGECLPPVAVFCRERAESVQVDETLRHNLSRSMLLALGAGAAAYDMYALNTGNELTIVYPVVLGQLSYRFGVQGTSELAIYAQLAPSVDPLTGFVAEYLQGSANLTDVVTSTLTVHLGVGGLKTVSSSDNSASLNPNNPDEEDVSLITGSADVTLRLDRHVDLTLGAQGLWQDHAGYGNLLSVFGYVALTVRAPPTRF